MSRFPDAYETQGLMTGATGSERLAGVISHGSMLIGLVEMLLLFACSGFTWLAMIGLYPYAATVVIAVVAVLVVMRRPLKLSPFG